MTIIQDWGRDHWGLLAYVETRCVDYEGKLALGHMRCNEAKHPLLKVINVSWDKTHGTRLKNNKILQGHDDWDCLEDLEREGFLEILSLVNGVVKLSEKGKEVASEIRKHKIDGGQFGSFQPNAK